MKSTINEHKKNNFKIVSKTLKFYSLFFIITLLGCTEENYYTTTQGLGKVNVYIEGNLTDAECVEKLKNEVGSMTENIYVQNTTQLTDVTINFSNNIRDIIVKNNPNLKNITLQGSNNTINEFQIYDGHYLNNIIIKGIIEAHAIYLGHMANNFSLSEYIDIECYDLVTVNSNLDVKIGQYNHPVFNKANFYDLKYINKTIDNSVSGECRWWGNYSEFNMPKLETVEKINHFIHVQTVTYPKLKKAKKIWYDYGPNNQTINFPLLERVDILERYGDGGGYSYNINLNMPMLNYCEQAWLYHNFTTFQVNAILNQFLTISPPSGKYLKIEGAGPSGQGIIDKQTLISNGNTVDTN